MRRDLGPGRIWGTTSISLVALSPDGVRYDFTGTPGDPAAWYPVPVGADTAITRCHGITVGLTGDVNDSKT